MPQVATLLGHQLCLFDVGVDVSKLRAERAELLASRRLASRSEVNYRSDFVQTGYVLDSRSH